ncbi:snoRNA-binding rRNA-processing protein, partial [Linderina pennispora]
EQALKQREQKQPLPGSKAYFLRGQSNKGADDDLRIEHRRRRGLADYDQFLRKFQYAKALDAVLSNNRAGLTVVSLLQELMHRDGLTAALAGRDELTLEPILRFLAKHIDNPRYTNVLATVAESLFSIYGDLLSQSSTLAELLMRVRAKTRTEIKLHQEMEMLLGTMDMLMSACDISHGKSSQKLAVEEDVLVQS